MSLAWQTPGRLRVRRSYGAGHSVRVIQPSPSTADRRAGCSEVVTRIAVVGAGLIGRKHLGILKDDPAFEVAGIADPAPEAEAYARQHGFAYFEDTESLLDTQKPDGVVIANPNVLHRATALACIARPTGA